MTSYLSKLKFGAKVSGKQVSFSRRRFSNSAIMILNRGKSRGTLVLGNYLLHQKERVRARFGVIDFIINVPDTLFFGFIDALPSILHFLTQRLVHPVSPDVSVLSLLSNTLGLLKLVSLLSFIFISLEEEKLKKKNFSINFAQSETKYPMLIKLQV